MATAHEIRTLIEKTTTGTHRQRVPEDVKEQVRRYAARRRTQGSPAEIRNQNSEYTPPRYRAQRPPRLLPWRSAWQKSQRVATRRPNALWSKDPPRLT